MVSLICCVITILALFETTRGFGPFVVGQNLHILDMNVFILAISLTAQFVSVIFTERNRVEAELRKSEARLYTIIDSSPIPKAINDDQQNIIFLNKAFTRVFGYTLDDIPKLAVWWPRAYPDLVYRQWVKDTWRERFENSLKNNTVFEPLDVVICSKDGSLRSVIASASPLESDTTTKQFLITLVDITSRKNLEAQLIKSHKFLEDLSNNIPVSFININCFPMVAVAFPSPAKG